MVSADVEKALAALPSDFRMAVILADLEDFSYKEIAEIMECPAGTVMSRLYRGRKMLQQQLYQYAVEQGIINAQAATPTADVAATRGAGRHGRLPAPAQGRERERMTCAEAAALLSGLRRRRDRGRRSRAGRAAPASAVALRVAQAGCRRASRRPCGPTCRGPPVPAGAARCG